MKHSKRQDPTILPLFHNYLFTLCHYLEARVGIEPTNAAFAEPCLTTWLPRPSAPLKLTNHPARASNCFLLADAEQSPVLCDWIESKQIPLFPQLGWLEDPCRRDDARDQLRRRHI